MGGCCLKELCLRQRIRVYPLCHGLFGLSWSLSILWCGVVERDGDLCQGRRRKGSDRLRVLPAIRASVVPALRPDGPARPSPPGCCVGLARPRVRM